MNNVDNFSSITDRGKAFLSINGKGRREKSLDDCGKLETPLKTAAEYRKRFPTEQP